jgi:hypothetical protein
MCEISLGGLIYRDGGGSTINWTNWGKTLKGNEDKP